MNEFWTHVATCITSSILGGFFVATVLEFNSAEPNRVRKNVMVALWLLLAVGATIGFSGYFWPNWGVLGASVILLVVGGVVWAVIEASRPKQEELHDQE